MEFSLVFFLVIVFYTMEHIGINGVLYSVYRPVF
jgi:hypothetical protein